MRLHRWAFIRELIPLALILIILDYLVFERKLFTFQPSPLWLIILLIAPRRGLIAGIVCGLTAAALNLWLLRSQGFLWEDLLHRQASIMLDTGLYIFFGAFLGAISERQAGQLNFYRDKANALAAQLDSDQIRQAELERKCWEMEKRIAGQGTTILTLHDNFKRLGRATNEEDLLFALDYILRDESKAKNYGVWRLSGGTPQLVAGNFSGDIPPLALGLGKNHKVISAAEWNRRHKRAPGADLAALVLDDESERLVVAVDGCPFVRLTRDFSLRIGLLADQAGIVLGALRDREKLLRQATLDTDSGLVSETYLRRRINEEVSLASHYNTPLTLFACQITSPSEKALPMLETVLSCAIRASIRYSDGVAWFPDARAFVVVMPQRDEAGAEKILKKVESSLEMLKLRDANNQEIYKLTWNIYDFDGSLKGGAIFTRLFNGMGGEASA